MKRSGMRNLIFYRFILYKTRRTCSYQELLPALKAKGIRDSAIFTKLNYSKSLTLYRFFRFCLFKKKQSHADSFLH